MFIRSWLRCPSTEISYACSPYYGQYPQAGYAGPAPIFATACLRRCFWCWLGWSCKIYHTLHVYAKSSCWAIPLQPPQRDLHGTGLNPPMPQWHQPQYLPPRPDFIDLGDDAPQRQMHSAGNAPGPQPEIHPSSQDPSSCEIRSSIQ